MPVQTVNGVQVWQRRDRVGAFKHWLGWLVGTLIFLGCWHIISEATTWAFVWDAPQQGGQLLSRMIPPRWSYLNQLWQPLWDTLNIATLGTILSVAIALPLSFLAARNTTPHPIARAIALVVIVTSRSVNSLIWALLLVAIIGPGVLAGVLSIALRSIGFLGKLFSEAIEEIDQLPVEAITATGASEFSILTYGIVPQVLPTFAGVSVFRWDVNIRESTVLGLVGAGGIGISLSASVNGLQWSQVSVIFIAIFAMVFLSEWVSATVRKSII
ncbi:MAG: phosphonate ABC transporter, permease protein PhnE [Leptolyngbyaceae cyanobacterium T60_A2020_046]|nr:phosphonate ABC transporter, permease protein PhnE [Leptolyngbyaceae cyanobacterium T60_A2020_046]